MQSSVVGFFCFWFVFFHFLNQMNKRNRKHLSWSWYETLRNIKTAKLSKQTNRLDRNLKNKKAFTNTRKFSELQISLIKSPVHNFSLDFFLLQIWEEKKLNCVSFFSTKTSTKLRKEWDVYFFLNKSTKNCTHIIYNRLFTKKERRKKQLTSYQE